MNFSRIFEGILKLDRRIIYTILFVCVTVPFYVDWPKIRVEVSKEVEDAFQIIDQIPPGEHPLLLSFDYDPASAAELTPMGVVILRHCFSKGVPVCVISLQATGQGAGIAADVVPRIAAEYGKVQNVDWCFLGFQPVAQVAMLQMGESIRTTFPVDYYGTPLDSIPMMAAVQNYDQIPAVVTLSSTAVGEAWIVYPGMRYGIKVIGGLTAVYTADMQPFYQSGQLKGILGGLKGAAEYEARLGRLGDGMAGMRSQKVVHYMIIAFIALGNIAFLYTKKKRRP